MSEGGLSELDYEVLDTIADADETTAIVLHDLRNPNNAPWCSDDAKALDFAALDAVFGRLVDLGLVARKEEPTDGFEQPRAGVSFTWWCMTENGRRAWAAWVGRRN